MIKATSRILFTFAVVLLFAVNVWATPVDFTPSISGSSVTVTDYAEFGDLTGALVLAGDSFTLADNATQTLDFFTLTASRLAIFGFYNVEATLAFSTPLIVSQGHGDGFFFTILGIVTLEGLVWNDATVPDYFTLADGNKIKIDFEDTGAFGIGDTMTVHAYVTNLGNAAAVPEPATMLLLGFGLMGLAGIRRTIKK